MAEARFLLIFQACLALPSERLGPLHVIFQGRHAPLLEGKKSWGLEWARILAHCVFSVSP